jgi:tRNA-(ms[2]io[6]A)-hydroxylase
VAAKVRLTGISTKKSAIFDLALSPLIYPPMLEEQLSEHTRNILGLQLPTDPRWVDLAGKSIEEILTDHAYCEQKAATSCISLIQRYSEREKLVKELAPIVTEEWGHFRLVLQELEKRNLKLGSNEKTNMSINSSNFKNKAVVWKAGCWINY